MHQSQINLNITPDEDKMPEHIEWHAPDGGVEGMQEAKAVLLGIWDGKDKAALRIDLWTKKMMVDEMVDFFYQSLMGMADTYGRATRNAELTKEMKDFAKAFHEKGMQALDSEK